MRVPLFLRLPGWALLIPGLLLSSFVHLPTDQAGEGFATARHHAGLHPSSAVVEQAAAMTRTVDGIQELLDARGDLEARDLTGQTALIWAADKGEVKLVKKLLKAGAEINAKDWWGRTALVLAIQHGHRDIVEMLVASQEDVGV
ncbi:MAG: ankyrin repeat domain-containing protein [Magnetococcales bacterium]|nr:ankyrin repeat domain-containing protein [Magnetococcales bacterium]